VGFFFSSSALLSISSSIFLLLRLVPSFYPSEQAGETGGWAAEGRRDGD
jgi:hypothetical protein